MSQTYSNFHIEVTDAAGRTRHAISKTGGGELTPKQLVEHFRRTRRFSNCKSVKITPIDGGAVPLHSLGQLSSKSEMDASLVDPQLMPSQTPEQFAKARIDAALKARASATGDSVTTKIPEPNRPVVAAVKV